MVSINEHVLPSSKEKVKKRLQSSGCMDFVTISKNVSKLCKILNWSFLHCIYVNEEPKDNFFKAWFTQFIGSQMDYCQIICEILFRSWNQTEAVRFHSGGVIFISVVGWVWNKPLKKPVHFCLLQNVSQMFEDQIFIVRIISTKYTSPLV